MPRLSLASEPAGEPSSGPAESAAAGSPAPFLSVLLPCWNNEATIEHALASALEVRSVSLEVIVVDDASTDATLQIVERVAATDPRVRIERLAQNGGASVARNRGLQLVRGEWLTLLDADDAFAPGGLERLVLAVGAGDALAVIGQQVWTDGNRRWLSRLYDIPAIRTPGRKSLAGDPALVYFVSPHAKVVHRTVWEGLGFEGRMLGDQAWVIRSLIRAGNRIDVLSDTVYEWSRPRTGRADSITNRTRSSARKSVEVVALARRSFEAVAAESAERLDETARRRVLVTYVERLLRSDVAVNLAQALDRADPAIGELIDAITGFVTAMPPQLLRGSDALATDILVPPRARWHRVNAEGRTAYGRLVAAALAADPDVASRPRGRRQRLGLWLALHLPARVAGPAAEASLLGTGLPDRVWRRLSASVRGIAPRRPPPVGSGRR